MARCAVPTRVVAGGTNIRATLAFEGVAPLHAAGTSQRDVPTTLNTYSARRRTVRPDPDSESGRSPCPTVLLGIIALSAGCCGPGLGLFDLVRRQALRQCVHGSSCVSIAVRGRLGIPAICFYQILVGASSRFVHRAELTLRDRQILVCRL